MADTTSMNACAISITLRRSKLSATAPAGQREQHDWQRGGGLHQRDHVVGGRDRRSSSRPRRPIWIRPPKLEIQAGDPDRPERRVGKGGKRSAGVGIGDVVHGAGRAPVPERSLIWELTLRRAVNGGEQNRRISRGRDWNSGTAPPCRRLRRPAGARRHRPIPTPLAQPLAAATARLAITTTRLARYSGEAWMSPIRSSGRDRHAVERRRLELLGQAPPRPRLRAEDALVAGAGDRDAHAILALGDEHAGHRIARGRVAEFRVAGLGRRREGHRGDDLAILRARSRTGPVKNLSAAICALVGDDGRAERQHGRGIVGRRIVVGDRAADRAHVAHMRIADRGRRARRAPGRPAFSFASRGDLGMRRGGADGDGRCRDL